MQENVLLTVLFALFAAAAAWLWWRRARAAALRASRVRRKKRKRAPLPTLPVVLAHGMFGFNELRLRGKRYQYFRGVPARLAKEGAGVHVLSLSPVASVEARAKQIAEYVSGIEAPKVNLIAHSMGGLDARYAIAKLGIASRVASLTTIGTPHRGTPLAELVGEKVGRILRMEGLGDMTAASLVKFNRRIRDQRGVAYFSHVGAVSGFVPAHLHPLLLPGFLWLRDRAGVNDGVVPSDSQPWGEVLGEVDADHWAQVGWSKSFDAPEFYATLLRELRGQGF